MAATIHQLPTSRNTPIRHYAILTVRGQDLEGIARLVPGGYAFRADGADATRLVAYNDPTLTLLGRCDLAGAQRAAEDAAGGLAALMCGYSEAR
jgi:hypothetical protein